ncbi:hypothetical protein [Salinimonas chungwhensis]|uniref:hypothetical protein n=1 Tax=Salinimonas chungwhensis TaxID=265425 RepID=UPI000366476F|nr:hypothetical protein [Salinimonas chungwhensis]
MIQITDYPQLEAILWDQKGRTEISDKEAFTYYESRWRYLDEDQLMEAERVLIDRLIAEQGNGHFLPAD